MDKRPNTPDHKDKGHASRAAHDAPLPDARSAEDEAMEPTRDPATEIATGDLTGQTSRGSYGTDSATGAGTYMDHNGTFSSEAVAQPGKEHEQDTDAVDPVS